MAKTGFILWCIVLLACNGKENNQPAAKHSISFADEFKEAQLPYSLADTSLEKMTDTTTVKGINLMIYIPDTMKQEIFGSAKKIRITPIMKLEQNKNENYYLVKASAGNKKAAFLFVFDKTNIYAATLPFLVPDNDPATSQTSSIDDSYTITKAMTDRKPGDVVNEGKEVYAYSSAEKKFNLIMTDVLDEPFTLAKNPIDTLPATNTLAGDYLKNDKNLIAVRDGPNPSQLTVFIHTENINGNCIGELKGEFIITSSKTAVYRQPGDPCVLELKFSGRKVSLNEQRGCGNYRGLDCPFEGSFTLKKITSSSNVKKNGKK